jgi:hypothetical protein
MLKIAIRLEFVVAAYSTGVLGFLEFLVLVRILGSGGLFEGLVVGPVLTVAFCAANYARLGIILVRHNGLLSG